MPRLFQPGNKIGPRFQSGQSGNPLGKSRARVAFEAKLANAIVTGGAPRELNDLVWAAARKGEAWALMYLLERFGPAKVDLASPDSELVIKVVYVESRGPINATGAASWPADSVESGETLQRGLLRPALRQDSAGDGPSDPPSASGEAGGVVQPDV
jgi:hypothetical protein